MISVSSGMDLELAVREDSDSAGRCTCALTCSDDREMIATYLIPTRRLHNTHTTLEPESPAVLARRLGYMLCWTRAWPKAATAAPPTCHHPSHTAVLSSCVSHLQAAIPAQNASEQTRTAQIALSTSCDSAGSRDHNGAKRKCALHLPTTAPSANFEMCDADAYTEIRH
jgi:hypothetical protein